MPLDRHHITRASMLMLPVDVVFNVALGLTWALQSPKRTSPGLEAIRSHYSPVAVGWVVVALGLLILAGLLIGNRGLSAVALAAGVVTYAALTVIFTSMPERATLSAPLWPLYLMCAHLASMISLAFDERRSS